MWNGLVFSDKYMERLEEFGYNVVRLPRGGIKPLQLLYRYKQDLTRLGELSSVITSGAIPVPPLSEQDATNISKERTSDLKIGFGLSILISILSIFGGNGDSLKAKYNGSSSLSFGYDDVKEEAIQISDLDSYLTE